MITGACLCGALRYEAESILPSLLHCHCSMCRKHHGAPFATFAAARVGAFRWVAGEGAVAEYASSVGGVRRWCGVCGAVAPGAMGDWMVLAAGNLVGELEVTGGVHAFVGSKAPWHVIADDLPRFEEGVPGWGGDEGARPMEVEGASRKGRRGGAGGAGAGGGETGTLGSCLCGDVRFAVKGAPARWMQCHCSRCRRGRSAAHGSNTFYPVGQFEWLAGRESVRSYGPPDAARFTVSFCVRCGGGAPTAREKVPMVLVPAGLFDGDPGAGPEAHIHVASKAPWYAIRDDLPQFAELPPS